MRQHSSPYPYVALASVCFFWGTTYLGIRIGLESLSPPVLICSRFLLSGLAVLTAAFAMKATMPRGREIWLSLATGTVVLGIGNGCLAYAELLIPSGLASLFVTLSPFWMVGIEAAMGGERLNGGILLALLVGLAGTGLLVGPDVLEGAGGNRVLYGFLILQLGCLSWSWGSLFQKRQKTGAHPIVVGGVQQLGAGLIWLPMAWLQRGDNHWTASGIGAIVYLAVFGSIIGYSSYVYALQYLPVSLVAVYTYVNPVVAVSLGWLFYREHFGPREGIAMLTIFVGVGLVKALHRRTSPDRIIRAGGPPHPVEPD